MAAPAGAVGGGRRWAGDPATAGEWAAGRDSPDARSWGCCADQSGAGSACSTEFTCTHATSAPPPRCPAARPSLCSHFLLFEGCSVWRPSAGRSLEERVGVLWLE
jgi:hypothetical protein